MNKISLNAEKTRYKYIFFHKQRDKDNILLCFPALKFNNISL